MKNQENTLQRANDRKKALAAGGVSAWTRRPVIFRDDHREKRDRERAHAAMRDW